jgi:hypothetical protein
MFFGDGELFGLATLHFMTACVALGLRGIFGLSARGFQKKTEANWLLGTDDPHPPFE